MPDNIRFKLRNALTKIVNKGSNNMNCHCFINCIGNHPCAFFVGKILKFFVIFFRKKYFFGNNILGGKIKGRFWYDKNKTK